MPDPTLFDKPEISAVHAEHLARIEDLKKVDRAKLRDVADALAIPGGRPWSEFSFLDVSLLHRHAVKGDALPESRIFPVTSDDSEEGRALNARVAELDL